MKNAIKWPVAAARALLVAIAAYVAVNSVDCEPPDMSKFDNRFVVPSDADNVYCGLVAVTNVVSEKTGRPILASLFDVSNGRGPIQRFHNEPLTDADKDAILAESSKALSLYHEAVRRKAAVEMAHEQWLSLARLWKEDEILTRLRLSIHRMESR